MSYKMPISKMAFLLFLLLFFVNALEAYSVIKIPLQWVSQVGVIALCLWVLIRRSLKLFPGIIPFVLLFAWSVTITVLNVSFGDYSSLMASHATTNYEFYIALRALNLVSFFSVILVVYWLNENNYSTNLINSVVNFGVIISCYSVYVYFAQTLGLPEFPRTRIGTSGAEQGTTFSYAFHRAMGSFREPSHLAEWLVLPLFLSYIRSKFLSVKTLLIGGVLLLTGSLTGIIGSLGGFFLAIVFSFPTKNKVREFFRLLIPFSGAFLLFTVVMLVSVEGGVDLINVIWERVNPIIEGGASESNRSYVYDYIKNSDIPFWGQGLGNSNLVFGSFLGVEATASFLSLFFSFLYSTGYIGLILLAIFMSYPLVYHFFKNKGDSGSDFIYILAAYIAWLIMFSIHAEEFSFSFGVIYALSINFIKNKKLIKHKT